MPGDYVKILCAKLKLNRFRLARENKRQLLLVEGVTDQQFLGNKQYLADDVECWTVDNVVGTRERMNHRQCIKEIIDQSSSALIVETVSNEAEYIKNDLNLTVYGLIDADYENPDQYASNERLFVTDASDLETFLLKTDAQALEVLIYNISSQVVVTFLVEKEEMAKAHVWAYQITQVKHLVFQEGGIAKQISASDWNLSVSLSARNIDFSVLKCQGTNCIIDIFQLLRSALPDGPRAKRFTDEIIRGYCQDIIKVLRSMHYNVDGFKWSLGFKGDNGDPRQKPNYWNSVNGHVFLELIKYIGNGKQKRDQPRSMENLLIDAYAQDMFYDTVLCGKMKQNGLIRN